MSFRLQPLVVTTVKAVFAEYILHLSDPTFLLAFSIKIIILYACLGILMSSIFKTRNQYFKQRSVLFTKSGYTFLFGVLRGTHKKRLQAIMCTFSMSSSLTLPHISDAYVNIGGILISEVLKNVCLVISFSLVKALHKWKIAFFPFATKVEVPSL